MDGIIQNIIRASLQARYDRIADGLPIWPWAFWMFFWGFLALLVLVILVVLYTTLLERKLIGWFQMRLGPNRVGPWGLLQPFADMIKLLVKEDIIPCNADKALHIIAPLMIFIPTMLAFVAIPFGAGTVELPSQLAAPSFKQMWMEWLPGEDAVNRGYSQAGFVEAPVTVETDSTSHKIWWIPRELDHDPAFVATDDNGNIIENKRYRFPQYFIINLQKKPKSSVEEPEYAVYFRVIDYESPGREYDTLELRFTGSSGHKGVIELGMDGNQTDKVEKAYSEMLAGIDPKLPMEKRFMFEGMPPQRWFDKQFVDFADSIAVNNRRFGTESMEPAFGTLEGAKVSWRDFYTPDLKNVFYIHGMVNRNEEKASLVFFEPELAKNKMAQEDTGYVQDSLDWRKAGGSFRVQRITGGGWNVEKSDGTVASLVNPGDSVEASIGNKPVKLTIKDSQYYTVYLMGKDIGIGILYILAVTSLTVLGIFMAGFGSNNKWSLYGAMRSAAQLMSYEIPMTLAVLGPVIMAASLSTVDIVEAQRKSWFVIPQFLAFFIFLVTMVSEVNRSPFDLPEAESELVAGFHTEYTGLKFGFFFLAEYANMFVAAAVITVLFFGGWKGPFQLPFLGEFVSSFFWFMLKVFFWLCVFIWFRATFPRFRIDQMMDYAWKVLLPLAFVNIIATAYFSFSDWNFTIWTQNNWHIWADYITPLFYHEYTRLYAIPIMAIITVLLVTDWIGAIMDHRRALSKDAVAGDSLKPR